MTHTFKQLAISLGKPRTSETSRNDLVGDDFTIMLEKNLDFISAAHGDIHEDVHGDIKPN